MAGVRGVRAGYAAAVIGGRTALIVTVPESEPAVGTHRYRLDPSARLGVPAHITVLFPFAPARDVSPDMVGRLAEIFGAIPGFEYLLAECRWFGDEVLWLAPKPAEKFRDLTERAYSAFPEYPPYGGEFDEVVPHLTVADHGKKEAMQSAEAAVRALLPIQARATAVTLIVEDDSGAWRAAASIDLGL